MLAFEFVNEMVNETVVEVLTTQMGITGGGLDLEDALFDGKERHIESATTQVEDQNVALTLSLLVETISDGSSCRLVDDTEDVETGNETGILGSLALGVVEVGRNRNDSIGDGTTEVGLGSLSHLGQDHGGDFFGSELLDLALELDLNDRLAALVDELEGEVLHISLDLGVVEFAADETLDIEDGVGRVHGDLVLCGITDETLGVCESHERGSGAVALVIGNDFDAVITVDAHTGVGGPQIDTCRELVSSWFGLTLGCDKLRRELLSLQGSVQDLPTAGAMVKCCGPERTDYRIRSRRLERSLLYKKRSDGIALSTNALINRCFVREM
jgi:hypothetical protein